MATRLLIAEDDAMSRRLIVSALSKAGYDVLAAANGREAWETLQREDVRLVVADWMMPEMDGLELVKRIRDSELSHYVYVVLLTSRGSKEDVVSGLTAGADDYVTKPFHRDELLVRIRAGERIVKLEAELEEKNRQLEQMAMVDGLTGIGNRRAFDEQHLRLLEHGRRFQRPYSLMLLDLDHFKGYNDHFGHEAGDQVLRRLGELLRGSIRTCDMAFRYGGEEFVCLLPETDLGGAQVVAERVRQAVVACAIGHPRNPPHGVLTVSIGLSCSTCVPPQAEELIRAADRLLYDAKRAGRNRVMVPEPAIAG